MDKLANFFEENARKFESFYKTRIESRINVRFHRRSETAFTIALVCFAIVWGLIDAHSKHKAQAYSSVEMAILLGLLFIGVICCCISSYYRQTALSKDYILQGLAEALQLQYKKNLSKSSFPEGLCIACQQGFIPQTTIQYGLWGVDDGLPVDLLDVEWQVQRGKTTVGYYGFSVSCHLRSPVQGYTVLVSDGLQSKFRGKIAGLKRIKLEWLQFEQEFDLFSTDEREVRQILAPDVMAAVYDLYKYLKEKAVCFVFYKDQLSCFYTVGPAKDLLEKENLSSLFWSVFLLSHLPTLLQRKGLTSAWQEKDFIEQRQAQYQQEMQQDHAVLSAAANQVDKQGISPLMQAIMQGDERQFRDLLDSAQVNVNQQYIGNGNSLLHLAALNGHLEMVRQLLAHAELNVFALNYANQTPLDVARERHHTAIVSLLEQYADKQPPAIE